MATVDAHLVAIDAKNGHALWNVKLAEAAAGYAMTMAPLVVKDKVIVGVAGGEFGVRGFIAAFVFAEIISLGGLFSDLEWGYVLAFAFFIVMMFIRPAGLFARRS